MEVIWNKLKRKNQKFFIFQLKIDFYRSQNIFWIWNGVYSDRSELDLYDETIRIQNFHLSLQLWWKKLLKITEITTLSKCAYFTNYQRYRYKILIAQIDDLIEDCVKISRLYLYCFSRNKLSKSLSVGWVHRFKLFS